MLHNLYKLYRANTADPQAAITVESIDEELHGEVKFLELELDRDELRKRWAALDRLEPQAVLNVITNLIAEKCLTPPRAVILKKGNWHARAQHELAAMFPELKILFVRRDPRARLCVVEAGAAQSYRRAF